MLLEYSLNGSFNILSPFKRWGGENDLYRCLIRVILREKTSKVQVFSSQNRRKLERKLGTKSSHIGRPKWPCATFTWLSFFLCFFGLFIFLISNFSFHHLILILYQTKEFYLFLLFHLQLNIKTKISFILKKKKMMYFCPKS